MEIPTIYICLRNDTNSDYPIASNHWLMDYVFRNIIKKDDENPEATAVKDFQRLLLCFMRLLRKLSRVWRSDNSSESSKTEWFVPKSTRICLWYLLAEPNTKMAKEIMAQVFPGSDDIPQELWKKAIKSIETDAEDIDINRALAEEWELTSHYLENHSIDRKSLLLIVWDEVRALVEAGIDGKTRRQESSISKFRLLRRALGSIGKTNSKSSIRIFTLFTDTTSRITIFNPLFVHHTPIDVSPNSGIVHSSIES